MDGTWTLSKAQDLIQSCMLPQLREDLDNIPIEPEHFKSYHECLRIQLPLLYDWIEQVKPWDGCPEKNEEVDLQEAQAQVILLLCELSVKDTLYCIDQTELLNNAERILQRFSNVPRVVHAKLLRYYQEKLHKDTWKRQMGATNGFVKYLKVFASSSCPDNFMDKQLLMFCLSVGLNIRTCYETHYKFLSTQIFEIMLQQGNFDEILAMNIHSVIYDAIFKDLHIMDSIEFIQHQWDCLLKCFDFYNDMDSFTWSKLDDSLEILLRNIPLAPNSMSSIKLMKYVSIFLVFFNINRIEFNDCLNMDLMDIETTNKLRVLGSSNTSYTCYRWAKTILQMFILESYRLMQNMNICMDMLMEIHRCYVVATFPINLAVIEPHLTTFFDKFTAVLMEVIKVQKCDKNVMQVITMIFESFYYHLKECNDQSKLFKYKKAYYSLLHTDTFKKYVNVKNIL
ncbi:uncharacterized protein LOC101888183 [Musca domestica]|uniref:Uncharacterized protein LOC101888183 n=1 Tax=Musca domestica TaxID=7370 RepID=A0A1I8MWK4_MUSDO|nr:uncharacterized protein LOC101888183 [Musca domestica]XP_011291591.1 uncharacterized protein LOC101888183 [Musca domestica]XP_011291592.1 uncharacterized protein LOC101888183 [Musca domestica]XP_019891524.1 uncharacterized protein LOC101888183 [Musca domestica]